MKKFKKFMKNNYILVTIIGSLVFIALASIIIIFLINKYHHHVEITYEDISGYQIIGTNKYEFDAKITKNDNKIVSISSDDYEISNMSPVYYNELLSITNDANLIIYQGGFKQHKLPKYSEIYKSGSSTIIKVNGNKNVTQDAFIYEPSGSYIFMDKVTLKYNDEEVELSPMSFVYASITGLYYYDYGSGKAISINTDINKAVVNFGNYSVNLLKNIIVENNETHFLYDNLDSLKVYRED